MIETLDEAAVHAPNGTTPPGPTIHRRIGLPSSRAVVGAMLVTVAVIGLFAGFRKSQAEPGSPFVIVATTVPAGQVIQQTDLAVRTLDLGEVADRTFTSTSQAIGAVAVQTLVPGQLLQEANVLLPDSGTDEEGPASFQVSFSIDRSRALGGKLLPGEVVDVVATLDTGGARCSTVVAAKATVIAIGPGGDEVLSTGGSFAVTLAIEEDTSVLGLVFAVDEADITIVRSTRVQGTPLDGAFCGNTALPGDDAEALE